MSTMKVTTLKNEASSVDNIVLNSDGSVGGELATTLASKLAATSGNIIQVVRATDTGSRSTTSTSFVDADISVTITPLKNDSAILLVYLCRREALNATTDETRCFLQITDNSNNSISGSEELALGTTSLSGSGTRVTQIPGISLAYATPATTSATTYKVRFRSFASSVTHSIRGDLQTSQLYAIEVSA